jgi:hypothetical protein
LTQNRNHSGRVESRRKRCEEDEDNAHDKLELRASEKYVDEAVGLGYLTLSQEEYEVTEDGDAFLKKCAEYSSRYSSVGRELENMKLEKGVDENVYEQQEVWIEVFG